MPDNNTFLQALFGEDAPFVHVTDFTHDPSNIPADQHLIAWKGNWFSRYKMTPGSNQYFTVSIFAPDEKGIARRRKALFLRTRVIVLDDVREKLSMEAVKRLPLPAWVLETSPGSEQWGYILNEPCADRARVENLLDGLVANGLAPDGRDPGMKGVTRYVRLPDGYNLKEKKFIGGLPFKCRMLEWNPDRRSTLEELAAPFHVNLDAARREGRIDGAANVPDHPLLQIPDIIHIKETRSDGRFDITCPWVDEHTGQDDSGSGIFTNDDGSIGFKCHHGGCMERNARDLIRYVESKQPGFGETLSNWRAGRAFAELAIAPSFMGSQPVESFMGEQVVERVAPPPPSLDTMFDQLKRERHTSPEARSIARKMLRIIEDAPAMERQHLHNEVCDLMHWSKLEFKAILKDLRSEWFSGATPDLTFLSTIAYVRDKDRFYDYSTHIFYTPAAFQNSFSDIDIDVKNNALDRGHVSKVDKLDFAPRMPRVFEEKGIVYGNTWCASQVSTGIEGDCSSWLNHWDHLGWSEHREHHLQWMAYTLKHPEDKINHALILGGMEGIGKDFLLFPLVMAMGEYAESIDGAELLSNHNEYLMACKLLCINETELGDHNDAKMVSSRLKRIAAAPPNTLRVNPKGITAINIRNIVNVVMTTNDRVPLRLASVSRRFHALWSRLNVRDENDEMTVEWKAYWTDRWQWMNKNFEACIYYLMNHVDISQFNPGAAPPMTEFLRDIRESSKSAPQITIENFIIERVGAFRADLITAADAAATLRAAELSHGSLLNVEASWFTPIRVGRILGDLGYCASYRAASGGKTIRVWAIRNADEYADMGVAEMYAAYDIGMRRVRGEEVVDKTHVKLAASN